MSGFNTIERSNQAICAHNHIFDRLNGMLAPRDILEIEADAIGNELKSPGPNGEPPAGLKDPHRRRGFPSRRHRYLQGARTTKASS